MKKLFILFLLCFSITSDIKAQLSATFVGDTVKIWDIGFDWSCSGKFFPITKITQDSIFITECDTMRLVTCSCYFTVSTSISGFTVGTYTAFVTRQHKEHITNPVDTIYISNMYVGSVSFSILTSSPASSKISLYQSKCNSTPGYVIEENAALNTFAMLTSHPNPFNPTTKIRYTIPNTDQVSLTIYNVTGQRIADLVNEEKQFGSYEIDFNGKNLPSGIYICRLNYGHHSLSTKLVLLK